MQIRKKSGEVRWGRGCCEPIIEVIGQMHKTKKNRGGGGGQVEGRGSGGVNVNQELKLSCKCIRKSGVRLGGLLIQSFIYSFSLLH